MQKKLETLKQDFIESLEKVKDLEILEKDFLWKKWKLNKILKWIKDLSIEEKKLIWPKANELKNFILEEILKTKQKQDEENLLKQEQNEKIDVTLEFWKKTRWHKHPISIVSELLEEIFISLWYKIEDWPQVEIEEYNFEKLNIPDNHPARDVWDTFWITDKINKNRNIGEKYLLRTHTSPVQIRTMLKWKLPIKIVVPGRVFRYEQEDARHTCNFYQLEGLMVWKWVTFWDLKWTLESAMQKLLWENTKLRFRPSIFPFTEPSAEVDVSCQICNWTWKIEKNLETSSSKDLNQKKCSMCSWTGWVELLWAWMVHRDVLEWVWIDSNIYSWFAFGMWIDRIAVQRFWINSSRMLYQSKLKLNEQF